MSARIVWRTDVVGKIDKAGQTAQEKMIYTILRFVDPYTPKDTGNLIVSGTRSSLPKEGKLIWSAPYAAKQYYGDHFKFDRTKNRKAGSRWVERMKRERMKNIEVSAQEDFRKAMK